MINERIKTLEAFLKSEPEDPFNWYALAMEYKTTNALKCTEYLNHLLAQFPNYLATYYQVAELLIEEEENEEAEKIISKGILVAKEQNDANTLRELQNLLNNLLFD